MTERPMTTDQCQRAWNAIHGIFRITWQAQNPVAGPDGLWFQVEIVGAEQPGSIHKIHIWHLCPDDDGQPIYQLDLVRIDLNAPTEPASLGFLIGAPERSLGWAVHELCLSVPVGSIPLT